MNIHHLKQKSKKDSSKIRITSNRKTTKGRHIYYQDILDKDGKRIKTIKHLN